MFRKILLVLGALLGLMLLGFLVLQAVPYGRNHDNPPMANQVNWDSPTTEALARQACFDCHSNETVWPWYSNIAPISWLIYHDVEEGRQELNFSNWNGATDKRASRAVREIGEVIQEGRMPPGQYLILHPDASLTQNEKQQLIQGLQASLK